MSTPVSRKTTFSETATNVSRSSTLVSPNGQPKKGLPPTPTLLNTIKRAPTVENVNTLLSNNVLQNSLQLLEQIASVGQVVPYVAPAFALLKFILDIEQRAKDVDAKCTDLLERINFMLGHLPALKEVKVNDATRQVIDRMNHALKVAALVIQAYRKQGAIARRLNLGNREKFTTCADTLNKCSQDLMTSLQIHTTQTIDAFLHRPIPTDSVDAAAESFINSHGGVEAVKNNPTLVQEFARTTHITIDDKSLEQLNANITELMQQQQGQLESTLSNAVNSGLADAFGGIVSKMAESEKEPQHVCVQCEKEYKESTNGSEACSYHLAEYDSWRKKHPCCGASTPCLKGAHRRRHHSDYPYSNFFPRAYKITGFIDTLDKWAQVEDADLEKPNVTQTALVARLLRWASRTELITTPTILIKVGTVWHSNPYFFDTFTAPDLESVAREVLAGSRPSLIFRTSESENEYSMAEWVVSQAKNAIEGVRLTAKAATSPLPTTVLCPIDPVEVKKAGDVVSLSEGGLRAYTPQTEYVLPPNIRTGPELKNEPPRPVRTDFKTRTTAALPLVLKCVSEPPLKANPDMAGTAGDKFVGTVSVFNKQSVSATEPITVAKVSASFRLVGDKEYMPVAELKLLGREQLPVTLQPRQTWALEFQALVARTPEDVKLGVTWHYRAFCARKRPLRLKLVLEDIEGEECSLVVEYVYKPYPYEAQMPTDFAFFCFDDPDYYERYHLHVTKPVRSDTLISFGGSEVDAKTLKQVVYGALKTVETEVELKLTQKKDKWMHQVFALVDVSCVRVYAFKIVLKSVDTPGRKARFGCIGYIACPEYGDTLKVTRPVRYAKETVKLEEVEYDPPEYPLDDEVDEWVPEPPKPPPASVEAAATTAPVVNGASPSLAVPAELTARLESIDKNLGRIATSIEKLVEALAAQGLRR